MFKSEKTLCQSMLILLMMLIRFPFLKWRRYSLLLKKCLLRKNGRKFYTLNRIKMCNDNIQPPSVPARADLQGLIPLIYPYPWM